jgi:hydroxyacylglutathione hydrolase
MKIERIALLADNYGFLLWEDGDHECAVVDPSDAGPVAARIDELGLELRWVLATHHHWDHTAGIEELATEGVEVIASEVDQGRVPAVTRAVADGEAIEVAGSGATCLLVPGHTRGAVAYDFGGYLFTGDTLFLAGCGRLFEGTPAEMYASLSRLAALPDSTRVYCGHEYTEKNLSFAAAVEPENDEVRVRLEAVRAARGRGDATVPGLLGEEKRTNPFLRCAEPALRRLACSDDPVQVFADLRRRRDSF